MGLTEAPAPRKDKTRGNRLFCSATTTISRPALDPSGMVSSPLPLLSFMTDADNDPFLSPRSTSALPTPAAYVLLNELDRISGPPRTPRPVRGPPVGVPSRGAAELGGRIDGAKDMVGSGAMRASRRTCTATVSAARSDLDVGTGRLTLWLIRSRSACTHLLQAEASSVENMYLQRYQRQ